MAFKGAGSVLAVGDGASPEAFTNLGQVIDVNGPDSSNDEIETTNLDSTSREFIAALRDNGSVQFTLHLDTTSTQHTQLDTDGLNGTQRNYRLTLNDPNASPAPYLQFNAFLSNLSISVGANETVQMSGTLRLTASHTKNW